MTAQINLSDQFTMIYQNRSYQYSIIVRHNGIVIAFAMKKQRKIYYSILNLDQESSDANSVVKLLD